jgi:hypothetical protein
MALKSLEARGIRAFQEANAFFKKTGSCYFESVEVSVLRTYENHFGPVVKFRVEAGEQTAIFPYTMRTGRYDVDLVLTSLLGD